MGFTYYTYHHFCIKIFMILHMCSSFRHVSRLGVVLLSAIHSCGRPLPLHWMKPEADMQHGMKFKKKRTTLPQLCIEST
jgi:hypothetical protein